MISPSTFDIISFALGLFYTVFYFSLTIEETFKITKSEFEARPVYLSKNEHIEAHFFTCFVSLIILRILEKKLDGLYSPRKIIDTLNNYSCSHIQDNYYLFDYRDEIIEDIEGIFGVDFSPKIMSRKKIKNILSIS